MVIGYFARVAPEKGLHNLVEAYRLLRKRKDLPADAARGRGLSRTRASCLSRSPRERAPRGRARGRLPLPRDTRSRREDRFPAIDRHRFRPDRLRGVERTLASRGDGRRRPRGAAEAWNVHRGAGNHRRWEARAPGRQSRARRRPRGAWWSTRARGASSAGGRRKACGATSESSAWPAKRCGALEKLAKGQPLRDKENQQAGVLSH